jgi:hypothetical protein
MKNLDYEFFRVKEGDVILTSQDHAENAAMIRVSLDSVHMHSSDIINGINITRNGIFLQGDTVFTGYGTGIIKSNYSENPKGAKMFTYPETVYFESAAKETAYKTLGEMSGINASQADVGLMPLITDVSAGPLPHVHTISMKHVHRIEPAYLYRIPGYVKMFSGFFDLFKSFLSA